MILNFCRFCIFLHLQNFSGIILGKHKKLYHTICLFVQLFLKVLNKFYTGKITNNSLIHVRIRKKNYTKKIFKVNFMVNAPWLCFYLFFSFVLSRCVVVFLNFIEKLFRVYNNFWDKNPILLSHFVDAWIPSMCESSKKLNFWLNDLFFCALSFKFLI